MAEEPLAVFKRVIALSSAPMVVGVSTAGFVIMTALSNAALDVDMAGMMVAPPSGLRTDAYFINCYHNTADALGSTPFFLQDFPLATVSSSRRMLF